MNGYATQLAFWKEETPNGEQTGDAYRPPGIVDLAYRPVMAGTFDTVDIFRAASDSQVLRQSWQISMRREPKVSGFENFWLEAITDGIMETATVGDYTVETWGRIDNPAMPTFGLEFILEDGNQRRYTGCAVARIEWPTRGGRGGTCGPTGGGVLRPRA